MGEVLIDSSALPRKREGDAFFSVSFFLYESGDFGYYGV